MNKKIIYIFVTLTLFFALINLTEADVTRAKVYCPDDNEPLNIRESIGGEVKTALACNTEVKVIDQNAGVDGSGRVWYQIKYGNGDTGYAVSTYIQIIPTRVLSGSDNIYIKDNYDTELDSDGFVACYEDTTDVSLRSTAGGAATGAKLSCGEKVKINSTKEGSGTCGYYYNVTDSKGNSGYVCGYYINTTKLSSTATNYYKNNGGLDNYYNSLRSIGFPESYLPYLAEIHARHPNWIFEPEQINLDFDDVVEGESAYGRNLLQGGYFSQNYLSMGINTYDILNDIFYDYSTEEGWYDASTEAIAYYMDPRTYLNEKYIFAFESLNFNNAHTPKIIQKILSSQTFWPKVYQGYDGNIYEDIITATQQVDISAVHIASRIKQEISGISESDPRLGGTFNYNGQSYSGYYNFFNIGVYGDNKIVKGMIYAKDHGWDSPFDAVYGGALFIRSGYIDVNQDTMYYQKFDVSTTNGHYTNQYMQNLGAPVQETNTAYNTYVNNFSEYLNTAIKFTIPVYENMSNYAVVAPSIGNPNNYLKNITIDGSTISNFSYDDFSYDIKVPGKVNSIKIGATTINGNATVKGTGDIPINEKQTTITLTVTSESGRSRDYVINVTKDEVEEGETVELSYILDNIGIKYNENYMYGISEDTDVKSLINNVSNVNSYASATIKDKEGNSKTSGVFKTGDKITISNSKDSIELPVVIYGDVNGDGVINIFDATNALSEYYGYIKLSGVNKISADVNKDGKTNIFDATNILSHYYKYITIEQ